MAVESHTLDSHAKETWALARNLAKPISGLMKLLSISVREDAKKNFDAGTSPDGVPWAPLKFTRARGGDKPLRDRGILMASMQGRGTGSVSIISGATLEQGTNLDYAGIHQSGGVIVPTKGKYLAIPRTPEAARAGSPRKFPRPLVAIFGKRGGVLVEKPTDAARKRIASARAKRTDTSRRIRNLEKAITRLRSSAIRDGVKQRVTLKHQSRIRVLQTKLAAAKKAVAKHGKPGTLQFILTKSVTIPARPFLGFGKRLIDACDRVTFGYFGMKERGE